MPPEAEAATTRLASEDHGGKAPLPASAEVAEATGSILEPERSVVLIGDLHGHLDKVRRLWTRLEARLGSEQLSSSLVIFLGDYCDRGPDTRGVLDWLLELRRKRAPNRTLFIAGNHDFAMGAYLGCMPAAAPRRARASSSSTDEEERKELEEYEASELDKMHLQGSRWVSAYSAAPTFHSYGVCVGDRDRNSFVDKDAARAALIAAVPEAHKNFLRDLPWVVEVEVAFPPGRLIAVHAGLRNDRPCADQLQALRGRDLTRKVLYDGIDRIASLSDRRTVEALPDELDGKAILVSGHHGKRQVTGDRILCDRSGGKHDSPLEALHLPSREFVSSDDKLKPKAQ